MESNKLFIDMDRPLSASDALKHDKLDRLGFVKSVVIALKNVNSNKGFVVSVEGAWGSGKTSTLAMIEELLKAEKKPPIIVNFNPWLIGDRDALLRLFLSKIADAVELSNYAQNGQKASKVLKSYAKAFDVIKLIPGAEPWASIIKSVVSSIGEVTGDISELEARDIESHKKQVEEELCKFPQPIIVLIDDIDRLFPQEVFEMIRIIKAVGDLPNVGYILAWDAKYVENALANASVPQSDTYLDKIVQARMPLPTLSNFAKELLINEVLGKFPEDALKPYFPNNEQRTSLLYLSGLSELLEQPRDIARLFNTVEVIEPALRGEIDFADILGLAAIMVKGPDVFDLLQRNPRWFVGRLPKDIDIRKNEDILNYGREEREAAYQKCSKPEAIRDLVHFLFPQVANINGHLSMGRASEIDGYLSAPSRLLVALQMSVGTGDVSLVSVKRYLLFSDERSSISKSLTAKNCLEFLKNLGDMAETMINLRMVDVKETSLSITRLVDQEPFISRGKKRAFYVPCPAAVAEKSIKQLIDAIDKKLVTSIPSSIVQDPYSITVAAEIMAHNYLSTSKHSQEHRLTLHPDDQDKLSQQLAKNILSAAQENRLIKTSNPAFLLSTLARISPKTCHAVLQAIRKHDSSLDSFALNILQSSFDSYKGQTYAIPEDSSIIEAYISIKNLQTHAQQRLTDEKLTYPAKAAWRSLLENKPIYGKDGSTRDD